ncbi:hypothetical protein BKA93DRAFT_829630 [Sparassis latifolia]
MPLELVREILKYVLIIPDATFSAFRTDMTFVSRGCASTVNVLLVSRDWKDLVRWLYESIILRTSAQVDALYETLSKNPTLRAHIRRLRVEVFFSDRINSIIAWAGGNLHTLYLSVDSRYAGRSRGIYPPHPARSGFMNSLQAINPKRLLLDLLDHINIDVDTQHAVVESILQWSNLERVDFSDALTRMSSRVLAPVIRGAPSLRIISIGPSFAGQDASEALSAITAKYDLRVVLLRAKADCKVGEDILSALRDILYFTDGDSTVTLRNHAGVRPLTGLNVPDLPDEIWSRILAFATHVHHPDDLEFTEDLLWQSLDERVNETRRNIILVSKRFYNLGVSFLYSVPIIRDRSIAEMFAEHLGLNPNFVPLVRVLRTRSLWRERPVTFSEPLSSVTHVMSTFRVFPELANNLKSVSPLVSLSQRLQEDWQDILVPPRSFERFPNLRTLSLSRGWTKLTPNNIPYDALPRLKTLKVVDFDTPPDGSSLIDLFTEMRLPELKEVHVHGFEVENACLFLQRHGVKLERLTTEATHKFDTVEANVLDLCPNIAELYIIDLVIPPPLKFLSNAAQHTTLKRILLSCAAVYPHRDFISRDWIDFFDALDVSPLVALSDICLPPKFRWPHDE